MFCSSKKWNPDGLHVYITGGSTGLGLSLAIILATKGAHVSIVARNQERLDKALTQIEAVRQTPNQLLKAYSYPLTNATDSAAALHAVCEPHGGQAPDAIFTCAGSSKPKFFMEMTEDDLTQGMDNGYWVQAWTAFVASKQMVRQDRKGKIVFVSSTLGFMSFLGYSSYSPAKHALRALGDTLHSELMLYGIDVHTYFPPTMYTLGYDEENKTKPEITKVIESDDEGLTADQAARAMFEGVARGQAHISGDFITNVFRASTRGAAYKNNWIVDGVYDLIAYFAIPIWRSSVDKKVIAHRKEHQEYLSVKGFFDES